MNSAQLIKAQKSCPQSLESSKSYQKSQKAKQNIGILANHHGHQKPVQNQKSSHNHQTHTQNHKNRKKIPPTINKIIRILPTITKIMFLILATAIGGDPKLDPPLLVLTHPT